MHFLFEKPYTVHCMLCDLPFYINRISELVVAGVYSECRWLRLDNQLHTHGICPACPCVGEVGFSLSTGDILGGQWMGGRKLFFYQLE
jgi:hypothetical protein